MKFAKAYAGSHLYKHVSNHIEDGEIVEIPQESSLNVSKFQVVIKKSQKGFGFTVAENLTTKHIHVTEFDPDLKLVSISDSSFTLRNGDRLVGIDSEDTRSWTLDKVINRLRSCPSNFSIRLDLERPAPVSLPGNFVHQASFKDIDISVINPSDHFMFPTLQEDLESKNDEKLPDFDFSISEEARLIYVQGKTFLQQDFILEDNAAEGGFHSFYFELFLYRLFLNLINIFSFILQY